jgi:hypothetical protein
MLSFIHNSKETSIQTRTPISKCGVKTKNALYEAITFFINYKIYIKLRIKKITELKNNKKNIV